MKKLLALSAFLILAIISCEPLQGTQVGNFAPDIKAVKLDSKEKVQLSSYRGKVVLLDFWATYCPPCIAMMPTVDAIYSKYHAKGFEVMAISSEPRDVIAKFHEKSGFQYPVLWDDDDSAALSYGVDEIPRMLLIGADGRVLYQQTGEDEDGLLAAVKTAMGS